MRGRLLAAVLSCAAQAVVWAVAPAHAQMPDPSPVPLSEPNLTPSPPLVTAAPQVQPELSLPARLRHCPLRPGPLLRRPAPDGEPPLTAAPVAPADPVVALIRAKLSDADISKDAERRRSRRACRLLWGENRGTAVAHRDGLLGQGTSRRCSRSRRPTIGGSTPPPSICRRRVSCRPSADAQALAEIKLDLAILKYARFARGGRLHPVEDQRAVRSSAAAARSEPGPQSTSRRPMRRMPIFSRSIPSTSSSRACARRCSRRAGRRRGGRQADRR